MASSKLQCERVSVERIERAVKRYGPINTVRLRELLGLSKYSAVEQITKCPNVRCVMSVHMQKVWNHADNMEVSNV